MESGLSLSFKIGFALDFFLVNIPKRFIAFAFLGSVEGSNPKKISSSGIPSCSNVSSSVFS
jgi:hypothetical protein